MEKLLVYYPIESHMHKGFPIFAERRSRLLAVEEALEQLDLDTEESGPAFLMDITAAHDVDYVSHVEALSKMGLIRATWTNLTSKYLQWYTRVSPGSYTAALYAAGAVIQAVKDVMEGKTKRAFCAVRPPGHHAGPARGEGFCLFNNVAIGALYAIRCGAKRVAIVDFDRHHGNGTEAIVRKKDDWKIAFISSYQEGCEYAEGEHKSWSPLIPIPEHASGDEVLQIYRSKVIPQLRAFHPDLILLSAGFDMHKKDPLTNIKMESSDYYLLTKMLVDVAEEACNGRIVSVLEGGYKLKPLTECVNNHLQALLV